MTPPFEWRELIRQLDEMGSKSLPLLALAGAVIGVVISLEARYSLSRFCAKSLFPASLVYSLIRVMGPIITGLVVSGRAAKPRNIVDWVHDARLALKHLFATKRTSRRDGNTVRVISRLQCWTCGKSGL